MELQDALQKAREYNEQGNPHEALKSLKPLYEADTNNAEVLLEMVRAFEGMQQWDKARGALKLLLKRDPKNAAYWARLTDTFAGVDLPTALTIVDSGLKHAGDDLSLILRRAELLADMERMDEMSAFIDAKAAEFPAYRAELIAARARLGGEEEPEEAAETELPAFEEEFPEDLSDDGGFSETYRSVTFDEEPEEDETYAGEAETTHDEWEAERYEPEEPEVFAADPDDATALALARTIIRHARTPFSGFQKTDAAAHDKAARAFCDEAEKVFKTHGYTALGDYASQSSSGETGKGLFFRLFLSEDQCTGGSAYYIKPHWPGIMQWVRMQLGGRWKSAKVYELETETADGRFIRTDNSGDMNVFAPAENVEVVSYPVNTPPQAVFVHHEERLEELKREGTDLVMFASVDDLFRMQERLRAGNNAYRERIGFVTDEELRKLLGDRYDRFAGRIRAYLDQLA